MRPALLFLALISAAAAVYFAWDRGAGDPLAIAMTVLAVLAAAGINLTPASRNVPPLPPATRLHGLSPDVAQPHAVREELSDLAANLEALAEARETASEAAFIAGEYVTVSLTACGRNEIAVIKVLRAHLGLGLREAKHLSDLAKKGQRPQVAVNMPTAAARQLAADIGAAGGQTEFA